MRILYKVNDEIDRLLFRARTLLVRHHRQRWNNDALNDMLSVAV